MIDPGACYDPDPALPSLNGNTGARYVTVSVTAGRVLNYSMNFVDGTPQAAATASVLQEFPGDVHTVWAQTWNGGWAGHCMQMEVASGTLGALLTDPSVQDAGGYVFVEFQSASDANGLPTSPRPCGANGSPAVIRGDP